MSRNIIFVSTDNELEWSGNDLIWGIIKAPAWKYWRNSWQNLNDDSQCLSRDSNLMNIGQKGHRTSQIIWKNV
jgi:hypothetical protein